MTPADGKVRWGVLSTAKINDPVLAAAGASEKVEFVAVASRDQARADAYARAKGIPTAHGAYEALLADPQVEAVYISLPNGDHVPWSIRALEAGKHVLCEKPLSRRMAQAEEAFDAAERAGRLLMEAFMYRHSAQAGRLAELVRAGAVGQVQVVRCGFSFSMPDPEVNVRNQAALEGGALMDVGCYCVSGARMVAGEPERVYARKLVGPSGVDVRFAALMSFPDGVEALIDCGIDRMPARDELEVVGDRGSLFLDDPWHARRPVIEHRHDNGMDPIEVQQTDNYGLELENLSDAIRGRTEPLLGRADAVAQAKVIEALYRSADEGRPVDLCEIP